jgi:D-sedoheptulose 7-phosphate isomerase
MRITPATGLADEPPAPRHFGDALAEFRLLFAHLERSAAAIDSLAHWTADLIAGGARLLVCGNGGSAAEAQHFATELLGRFKAERRPLPALALSADGALLTCISNDYSAEQVFARQVLGFGRPGDLLVALTTSGRSANVIAAVKAAQASGLHTLALLGKGGGPLADQAERQWIVPSDSTARIQEAHLFFIHTVCEYIDGALADQSRAA